jgi:hypothetical protein
MKKSFACLILIASLALGSSLALAKDTEKDLKDAARKIDKAAASPEGAEKVAKSLSEKFSVPPATIREFRAQKMGYGEIGILLALSQATGKTPSELLQRFKSGEGWGKIAKSEGVKLGPVISAVEKANPPSSAAKSKGPGRGEASDAREGKPSVEKSGKGSSFGVGLPGQSDVQGMGGAPGSGKGGGMGHGGGRK